MNEFAEGRRTEASASLGAREIERWLRDRIAALLELTPPQVSVHKPIASYGIDSAEAADLALELERWSGRVVPLDLVWEWATPREVATRLGGHWSGARDA